MLTFVLTSRLLLVLVLSFTKFLDICHNDRVLYVQLRTSNPEPFFSLAVIRQHLVHLVPEGV